MHATHASRRSDGKAISLQNGKETKDIVVKGRDIYANVIVIVDRQLRC